MSTFFNSAVADPNPCAFHWRWGGALSALTGNFFGRRLTIQIGCLLSIVGAAGMLGTSGNFLNYSVCKCISAVGLGHLQAASPMFCAECTPAHLRGVLLGLYATGLGLGNVSSYAVCAGSQTLGNNDWAWKIPIICQIPVGLVYGLGIQMFQNRPDGCF